MRNHTFEALHQRAHEAGIAAATAARPTPMHVTDGTRTWMDEGARAGVNAGACGFAWVSFPGTIPFARWAKQFPDPFHGRGMLADKHYPKGYSIWIGSQIPVAIDRFQQSVDIKFSYAQAYARVLREAGIDAHAGSRLD